MRLLLACAAWLLLVLPAAAQDAGRVRCLENAESTVEVAACLRTALARADAALNEAYTASLRVLQTQETRTTADRRARVRAVASLREAQRAWRTVRDKTCGEALGYLWRGGTGLNSATLTCKRVATEFRTRELRAAFFPDEGNVE